MKSYRIDQPKPKPKHRTMQDTATPGRVIVHNGCSASLAIPCWYREIHPPVPAMPHDRMKHDKLGWPTPTSPDGCCQEWDFANNCCRRSPHMKCCPPHCEHFVDLAKLFPIHLTAEGYTKAVVTLKGATDITAEASIDETDDWIIRVSFMPHLKDHSSPSESPVSYPYSVFVEAEDRRDLVALGILTVLPCPFKEDE